MRRIEVRPPLHIRSGHAPRPGGRAGGIWRRSDDTVAGRAFLDADTYWLEWEGVGLFQFEPGGEIVDVWPAHGCADEDVIAAFEREIGAIIFQARGHGEAMHASAAAGPHGAMVVCGLSGAGKSTCAFSLGHLAGWEHLADDQVLLSFETSQPFVVPRTFTPSLRPASRGHFGTASAEVVGPLPTAAALLAGIAVLQQDPALPAPWQIRRITAAEAFTAILPHAHCFGVNDLASTAAFVQRYLNMVEMVPVHRVIYRPAFEHLAALTSAIAALASAPAVEP